MGYGARPRDWKLDELGSMKTLSLSVRFLVLRDLTHRRQRA
jgi:hypothetical protein